MGPKLSAFNKLYARLLSITNHRDLSIANKEVFSDALFSQRTSSVVDTMVEHTDESPRPTTPTYGHRTIEISKNSHMTISVLGSKNDRGERYLTYFKVEAKALTTNSEYFAASLRFNKANAHDNLELKDDDLGAMRVCFVYMQAAKEKEDAENEAGDRNQAKRRRLDNYEDRAAEEALFARDVVKDIDIGRIWHIINAADKYLLDASILRGFFDLCYKKNVHVGFLKDDLARQVALPCYMFDHAEGFAEVTKWLAYHHEGHITEKRPDGFKWNHVRLAPLEFVGPINHARGALRTVIHRGIWDEIGNLLDNGSRVCKCGEWASTTGHYFSALVKTEAYPLEKSFSKNSVNSILSMLKSFTMRFQGTCRYRSIDWAEGVALARSNTLRNFDGLCIDCIDCSRPKRGDSDVDYWRQLESIDGRWDANCRVKHGEPSWYISWCGRAEHRQKLIDRHKEVNSGARRNVGGRF